MSKEELMGPRGIRAEGLRRTYKPICTATPTSNSSLALPVPVPSVLSQLRGGRCPARRTPQPSTTEGVECWPHPLLSLPADSPLISATIEGSDGHSLLSWEVTTSRGCWRAHREVNFCRSCRWPQGLHLVPAGR